MGGDGRRWVPRRVGPAAAMEDLGEEVEARVWARGRSGVVVKGEKEWAAGADKDVRHGARGWPTRGARMAGARLTRGTP